MKAELSRLIHRKLTENLELLIAVMKMIIYVMHICSDTATSSDKRCYASQNDRCTR